MFRKAAMNDIDAIESIYEAIHTLEEAGGLTTGWQRGVYPTRETARNAIELNDMFVEVENDRIVAAGRINREQVDTYAQGNWEYAAKDDEVMVLHTLTVDPAAGRKGYGRAFAEFYERYALENGCPYLRIDTNERNLRARAMYKSMGYKEIGIVPCVFNGIPGVGLVLLEKKVG